MTIIPAFKLEAQYRDYVWGGQRLRPGQRTAEAWAVYEGDRIASGPLAGQTLGQAAAQLGADLLGQRVAARIQPGASGASFPLLVKLLDCAEWLSLQVHPNDEQAVALEGPGHSGKTEAWHILQADPGAEILCGFRPGAPGETVLQSVRDGTIMEHVQHIPMHTGETVFIRAGTLHALGPGLLVYEVQQTSDITYRVFDWNRPASAGRKLHIDQSIAVLDTAASASPIPQPALANPGQAALVACPYFTLALLQAGPHPLSLDPQGQTFHTLTVIEGEMELHGAGWNLPLAQFETAVVPASAGSYQLAASQPVKVLKASVEG